MTNETKKPVTTVATEEPRGRKPRKKVYERQRQTILPAYLEEHFAKDNWGLRLVRWAIQGNEDYAYLQKYLEEGYEFVTKEELPQQFRSFSSVDCKSHAGLITFGDLCLMKADLDFLASKKQVFEDITQKELDAVSTHVLEKKGFRNIGSRTKTIQGREPQFQD